MNLHAARLVYAGCSAGLLLVDQHRHGLYLVKEVEYLKRVCMSQTM